METCNLISIVVKIIYQVFVRFNTSRVTAVSFIFFPSNDLLHCQMTLCFEDICNTTEPLSLILLEKSVCLQVDFVTLNMDPHVTKVAG